jgi:hypothetical protein
VKKLNGTKGEEGGESAVDVDGLSGKRRRWSAGKKRI